MQNRKGALDVNRYGLLFCIQFIITFLIFSVYPVIITYSMSFTDYKGYGKADIVMFDNYTRALSDPLLWDAFVNTLKIWGVNIVLQLGLALLLTVLFSDIKYKMKGLSIF